MAKTIPLALIVILGAVLAWMLFVWQPEDAAEHGALVQLEKPAGGDFSLTGIDGPVALEDFRGKVVVVYFGYTWCPDICPTSLSLLSMALNELSAAEQGLVRPVFVSVDPERDTPERLKTYVEYFYPAMLGVTGSAEEIDRVARLYGAAYRVVKQDSATDYVVDHSATIYIIGPDGRLSKTLPHGTQPAEILSVLRGLIGTEQNP